MNILILLFFLKVGVSVSTEAGTLQELQQWNDMYGEGGSRKKTTLSYFM